MTPYLHHLLGVVYRPYHNLLSRCFAIGPETSALCSLQRPEVHGERGAALPEVAARKMWTKPNMRPCAVWQDFQCRPDEFGMPQPENDARSKQCLPAFMRGDCFVHQREQANGVIEHLHVYVEKNMSVFPLNGYLVSILVVCNVRSQAPS